jgi:hypothetical protein
VTRFAADLCGVFARLRRVHFSEADKDATKLELVEYEAYSNGIQKQVYDVVR